MNNSINLRRFVALGLLSFASSFTLGACFDGGEALGLTCTEDEQCGLGQTCINGYCDGVFLCDEEVSIEASLVCDFIPDCPDGEDEDPLLCFEEDELWECDTGELIPLEFLCDGEFDCDSGSDELGCAGIDANECVGDDSGPDIAFEAEMAGGSPLTDPLDLQVVQLVGPDTPEVIVGSRGATQLEIVDFGDGNFDMDPMLRVLGPFDGRTVIDYDLGDINGDGRDDIVVATGNEGGFATHVYQNIAPADPEPYGQPLVVQLPGDIVPNVLGIGLGRLNNDSSTDMVAIADAGLLGKGVLLVSFGDSAAAAADMPYFTPELLDSVPALNYDSFLDMLMVDLDDNGFDDVVISAVGDMGPSLWVLYRSGDDLLTGWTGPVQVGGPQSLAAQLAVTALSANMGPDIVGVDPIMKRLQTYRNIDGTLMGTPPVELDDWTELIGITSADLNCDGRGDYLVYQDDTVAALLGDGEGGVVSIDPIYGFLDGVGHGRVAVAHFDDDGTPDIATTLEGAAGVQILLSTGGEFEDSSEEEE